MSLEALGFCESFLRAFEAEPAYAGAVAARVSAVHRDHCRVLTAAGSCEARLHGRLRQHAALGELPVVGDWVALQPERASIVGVLPRRGSLVRKRPERASVPQPMAANVDAGFIVSSLNADFEPRRIERALAMIWEAVAEPLIVLTKLDVCGDWSEQRAALASVAIGCSVHAVSAHSGEGMAELTAQLQPARTIALIGSSGAGKSTLINHWLGATRLATAAIRAGDDKGRHTTTHRELFVLPSGALLIDTPGIRELGLWDADQGLEIAFADVERCAEACRFGDCKHEREPGCAVQQALGRGELDPARVQNYRKLRRELAHTQRGYDARARLEHRRTLRSVQRQHTRAQRQRARLD